MEDLSQVWSVGETTYQMKNPIAGVDFLLVGRCSQDDHGYTTCYSVIAYLNHKEIYRNCGYSGLDMARIEAERWLDIQSEGQR